MVSDKTIRYVNKNMSLDKLSERIVEYLKKEGFEIQKAEGLREVLIQGQKDSFLKALSIESRCLTILLLGLPKDFSDACGYWILLWSNT